MDKIKNDRRITFHWWRKGSFASVSGITSINSDGSRNIRYDFGTHKLRIHSNWGLCSKWCKKRYLLTQWLIETTVKTNQHLPGYRKLLADYEPRNRRHGHSHKRSLATNCVDNAKTPNDADPRSIFIGKALKERQKEEIC